MFSFNHPMRKRIGNFLILGGLICLVLFFTSNAVFLDDAFYFFGGVSLISLGFLFRRGARRREKKNKRWRRRRDTRDPDEIYD